MERIPERNGHVAVDCVTCPAKTWIAEEGKYFCDSSIFIRAKHHPNGGARLRPTNCPLIHKTSSDVATQMLKQLLKR